MRFDSPTSSLLTFCFLQQDHSPMQGNSYHLVKIVPPTNTQHSVWLAVGAQQLFPEWMEVLWELYIVARMFVFIIIAGYIPWADGIRFQGRFIYATLNDTLPILCIKSYYLLRGFKTRGMVIALEEMHHSIQQTFISLAPVTAPGMVPSARDRRINNT